MDTKTLAATLDQLRASIDALTARVDALEGRRVTADAQTPAAPAETITPEELIAIAAAVAAFLGERPHIRQIRLVSSSRWAQQGRVSIQASHTLHHGTR